MCDWLGSANWHHVARAHMEMLVNAGRDRRVALSNNEMVGMLKYAGYLKSAALTDAFLALPRASFVPGAADEAYLDTPMRLAGLNFNVSAPHMHAMSLEALDLGAGQRVLDVGCGCGVVSALAALLVGKGGCVVGMDVLPAAVSLSEANLAQLMSSNAAFKSTAAPVALHHHNVLFPHASLPEGGFDRIYVGAACPAARLRALSRLLAPNGKMVVPVASELRLLSKSAKGEVGAKVLSQVRFGDLIVPSDAYIVLKTLEWERSLQCVAPIPPSTYVDDLAEASSLATAPVPPSAAAASSPPSSSSALAVDSPPALEHDGLGEPDCALVGADGWRLSAHKALLKVRCQHFRARFDSGMRDAASDVLAVPDNFSKETVEAFLHYVYRDALPPQLSAPQTAELAHAAAFFNAQRLAALCEAALADSLLSGGEDEFAADLAPQLLMLADAVSLPHLRSVALHF
eukprot:CAMPEP_0177780392 /NCGR_PEP_ID=MMETSP0491_2-20121128/17172_1 /TAXON_ID=63592 /ORGANISM="Tetraselmis chuii, Strain PLY429" /LENGTH=458 /DNA_ID=CAMNT_0019300147 /DNA_START=1307 /DNA_END=2680 /DNA_ORIENTATION=+